MQFSTFAIAAFAALTSAAAIKRAPADLCPALDTPQCCQVDVDGVLDLTCSARTFDDHQYTRKYPLANALETAESDLTTVADFETSCASTGLTAMCCTLPVVCCRALCSLDGSLLTSFRLALPSFAMLHRWETIDGERYRTIDVRAFSQVLGFFVDV